MLKLGAILQLHNLTGGLIMKASTDWNAQKSIQPAASTRHCPNCHKTKDISAFHKNKYRLDGLGEWCSYCDEMWSEHDMAMFYPMAEPKEARTMAERGVKYLR